MNFSDVSLGWGPATRLDRDDNSAQPGSPTGAAVSRASPPRLGDRSRHPHRRRDEPVNGRALPTRPPACWSVSSCWRAAPRARAGSEGRSASRSADASPSAQPRPSVPLRVSVTHVAGRLSPHKRTAVAAGVRRALASYTRGAFLAGDYPRTDFRDAFGSFTATSAAVGPARPGAAHQPAAGVEHLLGARGAPHGVRLGARAEAEGVGCDRGGQPGVPRRPWRRPRAPRPPQGSDAADP